MANVQEENVEEEKKKVGPAAWKEALLGELYPLPNADVSPMQQKLVAGLVALETATGQRRELFVYAAAVALGAYLVIGCFAQLVCNVCAFAYPAYSSLRALRTARKDDDVQWLTYWTVFALFSLGDFFADAVMSVLPLYWLVKCAFLLYLYAPQTRGADSLYRNYVDPLFARYAPLHAVAPEGEPLDSNAAPPPPVAAPAAVGGEQQEAPRRRRKNSSRRRRKRPTDAAGANQPMAAN